MTYYVIYFICHFPTDCTVLHSLGNFLKHYHISGVLVIKTTQWFRFYESPDRTIKCNYIFVVGLYFKGNTVCIPLHQTKTQRNPLIDIVMGSEPIRWFLRHLSDKLVCHILRLIWHNNAQYGHQALMYNRLNGRRRLIYFVYVDR